MLLNGRHALVTGAAGFVGANLVRALLDRGCAVTALVRPSSDLWRLRELEGRLAFCRADLVDADAVNALPEAATSDLVIHAAAGGVRPGQDPASIMDANVRGTKNLLELIARRGGCTRLMVCSSCSVYGPGSGTREDAALNGAGAYAASKIAAEALCRSFAHTVPTVILRLYTPYGPYEDAYRFVMGTILKALRGDDLPLTPGEQARDFIFVDDVTAAMVAAATASGVDGIVLNVSTGVPTTIREAVEIILECTESRSTPRFGALPYRTDEVWQMSGDPSRLQELLRLPTPLSFRDGVRRTRDWIVQNADHYRAAF